VIARAPLSALRDQATRSALERAPGHEDAASDVDERIRYLCRGCRAQISDGAAVFSPSGGPPVQVFTNPGGLVCQVLTLMRANGLMFLGPATSEYTWFPGYAWRIALCTQCTNHLGWRYEALAAGASPLDFFGLLVTALIEERA
jgi:cereblon